MRRAAALAIPKLSTDRRAREHLEDLLDDSDPILRIDVVRALSDLGDARSRGALRARAEVDLDPRVRRRIKEVVRDLGGERKQTEQLKEDVEKLQTEQLDVKTRLSRLEARLKESASAKKGGTPASKKSSAGKSRVTKAVAKPTTKATKEPARRPSPKRR